LASMYASASVFMALIDGVTFGKLGYYYFPNSSIAAILLILMPVTVVLSVEFSVIISSRVNDVRSAINLGALVFIPFLGIYIASEIGLLSLVTSTLLIISAIFLAFDVILYFVSTTTFRREEILTKWK
jgi:ABC-2 type transport system permease protein